MTIQNQEKAEELAFLLQSYTQNDKEFWAFRDKAIREHTHIYFQYPAMMVPKMQGQLIQTVKNVDPTIKSIFDPFVGSGTTLTEAMMQGLDFVGYDINPLAVLICRAKLGPFKAKEIQDTLNNIIDFIRADQVSRIEVHFSNQEKWFQHNIAVELSKIRRAIQRIDALWCRRFFWVALAETVRLTSNSRTSTFKLHIREEEEIAKREKELSPIKIFEELAKRNLMNLSKQRAILMENKLLIEEYYQGNVDVILKNSLEICTDEKRHDLLVTSPPYGDNATTVPYGQHSYLPLQWIDLEDVDQNVDQDWLKTTCEIDSRSLGGSRSKALESMEELCNLSETFKQITKELEEEPRDRIIKVTTFYRDLNRSLNPILATLKPNACMIWTVGNRRVAGKSIPIDSILSELLIARGASLITRLQRNIPTKRMAPRNQTAPTMHSETILVFKKGNT